MLVVKKETPGNGSHPGNWPVLAGGRLRGSRLVLLGRPDPVAAELRQSRLERPAWPERRPRWK
ncbi:hypothetical protein AMQ84_27410 [Paenibacillus riograndensis]|uniref:Uncharacterized protein n=1 Tax=Paenibacillus riograndensis TaxID=483937 RepID=A0A132TJX7_9BACL|nr:hypothetical protein AMQ84_27410 [Paenibacillus riograndensis]KWX88451.1 hypothetical protein AMQ83_06655 [Paenibacillus riograndensis]